MVGDALVGHQLEEAEVGALFVVSGNEGALPLPAHDQVLGRKLVDRLAHRALADLEARSEFDFAGHQFARLPFARLQALRDQGLDLLVQRPERRRAIAACAVAVRVGRDWIHRPRFHHKRPAPSSVHMAMTCVLYKTYDIN
jgi:hypothetical protein